MSDMTAFFTRETANEGVKIPLSLPDGSASEHWLVLRSVDSDAFRAEDFRQRRRLSEVFATIEDEEERDKRIMAMSIELLASTVISWSFEQACTKENVIEFLTNAPHIADAIDTITTKRALFTKKKQTDLESSSESKESLIDE